MQTVRHNGKIVSHTNKMFLFLLLPPATKAPFFSQERQEKHLRCLFIILMSCFFPLIVFKNIRFLFLQFSNEFAHIANIMRSKIFFYFAVCRFSKHYKNNIIFLCIYFCRVVRLNRAFVRTTK